MWAAHHSEVEVAGAGAELVVDVQPVRGEAGGQDRRRGTADVSKGVRGGKGRGGRAAAPARRHGIGERRPRAPARRVIEAGRSGGERRKVRETRGGTGGGALLCLAPAGDDAVDGPRRPRKLAVELHEPAATGQAGEARLCLELLLCPTERCVSECADRAGRLLAAAGRVSPRWELRRRHVPVAQLVRARVVRPLRGVTQPRPTRHGAPRAETSHSADILISSDASLSISR